MEVNICLSITDLFSDRWSKETRKARLQDQVLMLLGQFQDAIPGVIKELYPELNDRYKSGEMSLIQMFHHLAEYEEWENKIRAEKDAKEIEYRHFLATHPLNEFEKTKMIYHPNNPEQRERAYTSYNGRYSIGFPLAKRCCDQYLQRWLEDGAWDSKMGLSK
jgi:hypothetical protein